MKNILVIEDDSSVRAGILDLLIEEGFNVRGAENGRIGVEAAREMLPDLIISDILMPELDGHGVLNELQKDALTASIPFIFLSARTGSSDVRSGMNGGADDYLTKPYKAQDLLDAVNSRLKKVNVFETKVEELSNNIARALPHELRTPLVSILGFSQIISEDGESLSISEIKEFGEKINTAGYGLLNIIQKFLLHGEIEALSIDKTRLSEIKESALQNAGTFITQFAKITAQKHGRTEDLKLELVEGFVKISDAYLQIITEELVDNAFKFSDRGSVVRVSSDIIDNFYVLSVTDHGIGISFQQLQEIGLLKQFDRDKNYQNGVGLGLSLVKKLLELHNGFFEIGSEVQKFTFVKASIPVAD